MSIKVLWLTAWPPFFEAVGSISLVNGMAPFLRPSAQSLDPGFVFVIGKKFSTRSYAIYKKRAYVCSVWYLKNFKQERATNWLHTKNKREIVLLKNEK